MRPEIFPCLGLLFLACGVPSNAQSGPSADKPVSVSVRVGAPLTVECSVRVEQRVEWRLDGGAVPADLAAPAAEEAPAPALGGRLYTRLHAPAARPHHAGLYTCSRDSGAQRVRVLITGPGAPAAPAAPAADSAVSADEGEATTAASAAAAAAGERAAAAAVAVASVAGEIEVLYDVGRIFSLNCTPPQVDKDGISYVWKKNGTALESVWELTGRHKLDENNGVFRMTERALESDFGNYTCEPAGAATVTFHVRGRPYAKLASDTNVVEDTKLKIVCKLVGKPYPGVTWTFSNDSASTGSDVQAALGARVTLATSEQGVEQAELVVEAAQRADAGVYTCVPRDAAGVPASTTLRVKDKYAALWPFLGICAEVFVLCAIILVYEKRRTKPELDDSDTDNHDQKKS